MNLGDELSQRLRRLGALNVSRSKATGPAPNKLLLGLSILYLFEDGLVGTDGLLHNDRSCSLRPAICERGQACNHAPTPDVTGLTLITSLFAMVAMAWRNC